MQIIFLGFGYTPIQFFIMAQILILDMNIIAFW